MTELVILGALTGGIVSAVLPFVAIPILRSIRLTDTANHRSSHRGVALRGLGIAPWGAFAAALVVALTASDDNQVLTAAIGASLAIGLVGLVEDIIGLPVGMRIGLQVAVGIGLSIALAPALGGAGAWTMVAIAAFFIAYVNIANFMDGVDGISGLHGVVVGAYFAAIGVFLGVEALVFAGALLAISFGAFTVWNIGPQLRFLGDVGSYLLGGAVAGCVGIAVSADVPLLVAVSPVLLHATDAAYTLSRRILSRARWYEAHREHLYQRLSSEAQWGHLPVALVYALVAAALSSLGALMLTDGLEVVALVGQGVILIAFVALAERAIRTGRELVSFPGDSR